MRRNLLLPLSLVMMLSVMPLLVSCAKDSVQVPPSVQANPPVTSQPELPTDEAKSAEMSDPAEPIAEATVPETSEAEFVNDNIPFAFDSAALSEKARQILKYDAEYLHKNPDLKITVEGHCDQRGTDAYNLALGDLRANSVKDFLVILGIDADRLYIVSYGEERPIARGQDEVSWAKNRRAQLVIQ